MDLKRKFEILLSKFKLGHFDEVIFEATLLSKKYPNQEVFINLLSLSYQAKGQFSESIKILEEALKRGEKNFNFWNNLGLAYLKIKNFDKAKKCLTKANELNPKFINTLNNLGNLYVELNNFDKGEFFFREALKINNKIIETNYNLATLLQSVGKISEAREFYKKTLDINQNFTRADFGLAMLEKYETSNKHIKIMENKINQNLHKSNYKDLYFALGKVYEDINEIDKAFTFLKKGNNIKKEITNYKIENDEKLFKKIVSFHSDNKLKNNNSNKDNKKLIFILGMPRTGTSMVEQIISNHSEVEGGGEISILSFYLDKFFKNTEKAKDIESELNFIKNEYLSYLDKISKSNIITDKAPLNFRWIGIIKYMFPNCKIVHCKRDPLENSWSIFKNEFERGMFFSNTFEDISKFYDLYNNLMKYWEEYGYDRFNLDYEDLVNNPENKIREIISYCDLEWQQNCLEFYKNKKSIKTVSFMQARKPIYKDSLKGSIKFKKYLAKLESSLKN